MKHIKLFEAFVQEGRWDNVTTGENTGRSNVREDDYIDAANQIYDDDYEYFYLKAGGELPTDIGTHKNETSSPQYYFRLKDEPKSDEAKELKKKGMFTDWTLATGTAAAAIKDKVFTAQGASKVNPDKVDSQIEDGTNYQTSVEKESGGDDQKPAEKPPCNSAMC